MSEIPEEVVTEESLLTKQLTEISKQLFGIARMLHSIGAQLSVSPKLLRDNYNNAQWSEKWALEDEPNFNC